MKSLMVAFYKISMYTIMEVILVKKYSVLMIDLKKSKSYKKSDRIDIQNYIKRVIEVLNEIFDESLERKVIFSAGDEIQGLFNSSKSAYLYFRLFNILVFPVKIRAGIGVGEWNIKIDSSNSTEQDGQAYHNARSAIDNVQASLGYSVLLYSKNENDIYINSVINAATLLTNNQSSYQNELFILTELIFPIEIKSKMNIERLNDIKHLISYKNNITYYCNLKSNKNIKSYPSSFVDLIAVGYKSINPINDEDSFFVSIGKIRGLAIKLEKILEVSRQSIEKSIKAGNFFEERNFTIVALKLMNKCLGGEEE